MFEKSRQLIRMHYNGNNFFIDTPGYLYHYKPYGVDIFIHHKIKPNLGGRGFHLLQEWTASDPTTGLALLLYHPSVIHNRNDAVLILHDRLSNVSFKEYNEAIWNKLADSPPHKASWRFNKSSGGIAVKVEE